MNFCGVHSSVIYLYNKIFKKYKLVDVFLIDSIMLEVAVSMYLDF